MKTKNQKDEKRSSPSDFFAQIIHLIHSFASIRWRKCCAIRIFSEVETDSNTFLKILRVRLSNTNYVTVGWSVYLKLVLLLLLLLQLLYSSTFSVATFLHLLCSSSSVMAHVLCSLSRSLSFPRAMLFANSWEYCWNADVDLVHNFIYQLFFRSCFILFYFFSYSFHSCFLSHSLVSSPRFSVCIWFLCRFVLKTSLATLLYIQYIKYEVKCL